MSFEKQYLQVAQRLMSEGVWVNNERTGVRCLTLINVEFEYGEDCPLLTTKRSFPVSAVAEVLGYLRGYKNSQQFIDIGTTTWEGNTNDNEAWLNNPYREGEGDLGRAYGVVARDFGGIDTIEKVLSNISKGIDDRGEIITFWKPDDFDKACLRPCLHSYHFSILDGTLYLHATQRSADFALGAPFNAIQCWFMLNALAKVSNLKVGKCFHKIVNCHIYENHWEGIKEQLARTPLEHSFEVNITDSVCTYKDLITGDKHAREFIGVKNYEPLSKIAFEMVA